MASKAVQRLSHSAVDWARFAAVCPTAQMDVFRIVKAKHDNFINRVHQLPENLPKIDFASYKARLPDPTMADRFQKAYEALEIPYPKDKDNVRQRVEADNDNRQKQVQEFTKQLEANMEESKKFLSKIDTLPKLEDMTLEAYYYYFPGTAPDPDRPLFWPPNDDEQVYNPNYHQRRSLMVIGCDYFMPVLLTLLRRVVIMAEGQARAYTSGTASMAFVTVPNAEVGKKIAGGLVQNKLAACVNIIPQVTSVYEWEGKIEEDSELILMIKTLSSKVDAVSEFVRKNHPYDCAEVISSPIDNGNPPYLKWISDIVGAEKDSKM